MYVGFTDETTRTAKQTETQSTYQSLFIYYILINDIYVTAIEQLLPHVTFKSYELCYK